MTGELRWYHENGSVHDCDVRLCDRPAAYLWEMMGDDGTWGWHLCREHCVKLGMTVIEMVALDRDRRHDMTLWDEPLERRR